MSAIPPVRLRLALKNLHISRDGYLPAEEKKSATSLNMASRNRIAPATQ